ncbi:AMIN-like domain-containing (lipo)protein [Streptomyces tanashiensis]|uniref:AMIN-like domain-containing (lipo)protein n=1 Tax=Streptomyces tanashiensis TaxID=67367 RepID=UPI0033DA3307
MRTARRVLARFVAPAATALLAAVVAAPVASAAPARAAAEVCDHSCIDGVRAATHTGYDRVVFDLGAGALPQVTPRTSTDGTYYPPSGQAETVAIAGSSYLFLDFSPARIGDYAETNPLVKPFALPTVKGVEFLYEQHAQPEFAITLNGPVSRYNVFTLTQPNRVVVDIYR